MNEFLLLMQGDDSQEISPDEMQTRLQNYMGWMKKMTERGVLKAGQPLEPRGVLLENKDTVITDGPFLEPKEIIGGYIILTVESIEEATELAKSCPLLDHCRIMVRPLVNIPG